MHMPHFDRKKVIYILSSAFVNLGLLIYQMNKYKWRLHLLSLENYSIGVVHISCYFLLSDNQLDDALNIARACKSIFHETTI